MGNMSWEVINTHSIKCLCGNGTIEQIIKGDDWNRLEEMMPVIKCKECSKKYVVESKYYNPKPGHDYFIYYCVDKDSKEKIQLEF